MIPVATIAALAAGIAIGTRLRAWRRSSQDPVIDRTIKPPKVKYAAADEGLAARAAERRKFSEQMQRDASAVRSGDHAERFKLKMMKR